MSANNQLGEVLDVRQTRVVLLHDVWAGYNEHSPIAAVYQLRRGARGGLAGDGRFSTRIAGERVVEVAVPARATTRFLDGLAGATVIEGSYEPRMDWTDDYPHIQLALHVGVDEIGESGGIALLFTRSQGEFHAPWGACVDGRVWTLPGDEIGRALAELRGPLKRATLDRMMRDAERRDAPRSGARTTTDP